MTMGLVIIVARKDVHALDEKVELIQPNVNAVVQNVHILIPIKNSTSYREK